MLSSLKTDIDESDEPDEDTQQAQKVTKVDAHEVQAILDIMADHLRYDSQSAREYVVATLRARTRESWMPTCTAQNIGDELAVQAKQAADGRAGMVAAYEEDR